MTQPTTSGTEPRQTKPAAELEYGDHIYTDRASDHDEVLEVRHVEPYGISHQVNVMVRGGYTFLARRDEDIDLATEQEVTEGCRVEGRRDLVFGLHHLADAIEDAGLNMPALQLSVHMDSPGDLAPIAAGLGVVVEPPDGRYDRLPRVHWQYPPKRAEREYSMPRLSLYLYGEANDSDDAIADEIDAAFAEPTETPAATSLAAGGGAVDAAASAAPHPDSQPRSAA